MSETPKSFVLNDESATNSYGFRVINSGINLERLRLNPVILAQHVNSVWTVIGRWENIRIEGSRLMADPVFDTEDPEAQKIAGKVERGFIKGVSLGLAPDGGAKFRFQKGMDGVSELIRSEALEASIVAIPSNRLAVKLYAASGSVLSEKEISLSLFSSGSNNNPPYMNELKLSVQALLVLGLQSSENPLAVGAAVETLTANFKRLEEELQTGRQQNAALQAKLTEVTQSGAKAMIDEAIKAGKITADRRESMIAFAVADPVACAEVLAAMPARVTLSSLINNPGGNQPLEIKTEDDFQKLTLAQQLSWKAQNPESYLQLFNH